MSFSPPELLARAEIARPLFSIFVEAALKGTVVLLVAWALARALRHTSASIRHLIWTAGLAGVLIIPLLTIVMPRVEIALPELGVAESPRVVPAANGDEARTVTPSAVVASNVAVTDAPIPTPVALVA